MYSILLSLHSLVRWLVLASLLYAIINSYIGWRRQREFSATDNAVRHWTATIVHIQFMLGIVLYFLSPIVSYFHNNFREAVHLREIRFFGMEHSLMMVIAVSIISVGSAKAKRKSNDQEKFKTIALWFFIGLLFIMSSIPWSFSPLVNRPNFRGF
jgi:NADH:ubiquinone oxidoreductase subunit 2 (subunit N)